MLTLGIPNFNRKDAVCANVKEMVTNQVHEKMKVLIIDDASPDGAYEALMDISNGTSVTVLQNEKNLGLQGNIIRLFEECKTEYLVVLSNEDIIISENIDSLLQFIEGTKPTYISTQFYLTKNKKNILYRGKAYIAQIKPEEVTSASFYITGLVYKTNESLKAIQSIRYLMLNQGMLYPTVLLTAELLLRYRNNCFWWNKPITKKIFQLNSDLIDKNHGKYYYLPARWNQQKLFVDFYQNRLDNAPDQEYRKNAFIMLEHQKKAFIGPLRHAISMERPDLLESFDLGAKEFYSNSFGVRLIKLFKRFVNNPVATTKHAIKRLTDKMVSSAKNH